MSEKLGFVFGLFIFFVFIIPFGMNMWYLNLQSDHFMKITNEIHKLTNQEGGATNKVIAETSFLEKKGFTISFKDANNNEVIGACNPGDTIYIIYSYKFKNVYGNIVELKSSNSVLIQKRRSE
ncbi:MAG: hypothetical protein K0R71_1901 [Bacillales bacterium]|nr:hypothetical protein [Bacillales bacterium]